jgi:hypothetical protein
METKGLSLKNREEEFYKFFGMASEKLDSLRHSVNRLVSRLDKIECSISKQKDDISDVRQVQSKYAVAISIGSAILSIVFTAVIITIVRST